MIRLHRLPAPRSGYSPHASCRIANFYRLFWPVPPTCLPLCLEAAELCRFFAWPRPSRPSIPGSPEAEALMARRLAVWEARHENGWTTTVTEQMNGSFIASVRRKDGVGFSAVVNTIDEARVASLSALERTTGHAVCSPDCSGWMLISGAGEGAEPPARVAPGSENRLPRRIVRRKPTGSPRITRH